MTRKQWTLSLVALVALAVLVYVERGRIHFDFGVFRAQLMLADWKKIGLAIALIYTCYIFRSVRWARLLRHHKKIKLLALLDTQVIGFTTVALIGRVADPVRPYLVAKKTGLPLSSQLAVYIVERLFDMSSMALVFCSAILLAPAGSLPHPEIVRKVGLSALTFTVFGALFLVVVRVAGNRVASVVERGLGKISEKLAAAVGEKIRAFHAGLDILRSFGDFATAFSLSLGMWVLIALAYLETTQAFVASPQLAQMTIAKCMLLMASGMVASGFQLPIIGWFTTIGVVTTAMSNFFGVALEPATACAATLLTTTFLSIIPIGLVWAQFTNVSLRKVAAESGQASEGLSSEELDKAALVKEEQEA